ncbi:PoNe immunity protein domain-containing protein [Burkholderia ambifaria]|uniref:PoNe immunity protein domain-containing protein n=1 Tax=Burkholderia ambifaria TaxID=152480 RepID=UPI0009D96D74
MEKAGWHDTHLDLSERGGGYFGYWAIEAAAIAYLRGLADAPLREHIVYPKDLVDFARTFEELPKSTPVATGRQAVRTGRSARKPASGRHRGTTCPACWCSRVNACPRSSHQTRAGHIVRSQHSGSLNAKHELHAASAADNARLPLTSTNLFPDHWKAVSTLPCDGLPQSGCRRLPSHSMSLKAMPSVACQKHLFGRLATAA